MIRRCRLCSDTNPPEEDHAVNDDRDGFYVETLLLCLALWWGLWRSASRLTDRH